MTLTLAGEPLIAYLLASVRILAWLALVPPFSARAVRVCTSTQKPSAHPTRETVRENRGGATGRDRSTEKEKRTGKGRGSVTPHATEPPPAPDNA